MIYNKKVFFIRSFIVIGLVAGILGMPSHADAQDTNPYYEVTLEQLGYTERTLQDPYSAVRYYYSLPANWLPNDGTYAILDLNLSYSGISFMPSSLLVISLNNQVILSTPFQTTGDSTLQVNLPKDVLYEPNTGIANVLELEFISYVDCNTNTDARVLLTVRNSSLLHFTYTVQTPTLNLKDFPAPLYFDQSLIPSGVGIVLPNEPSRTEFETALTLAARLGASTRNNIPLSVVYADNLTTDWAAANHLLIIGTPGTNPLITQMDLPVSPQLSALDLHSYLPVTILSTQPFTMGLAVRNTSGAPQTLILRERFPEGASIDCQGNCIQHAPGIFEWNLGTLEINQEKSINFVVTLDGAAFPQGSFFEHGASLINEKGQVVSGNSLSGQVDPVTKTNITTEIKTSQTMKGTFFFVQGEEAIVDGDGIIQETVSPWNPGKVVIVLTGLSDKSLQKAGRALGATTGFPGMDGPVALVKSADILADRTPVINEDSTFKALGYQDVKASYYSDLLQVNFDVPPGWAVDEDAALRLHYSYSAAMSEMFSALEIGLNGLPLKSILLDKQDITDDLWAMVNIPKDTLNAGPNRLSFKLISDYPECVSYQVAQSYWARIFSDSYLHLPHTIVPVDFSLDQFPYIFTTQSDLSDVTFALPTQTSQEQLHGLAQLASFLGYAAGGDQFLPSVVWEKSASETSADSNIIAYGRPTENLTISAINDSLPQRFIPGTDKILQNPENIIYRMPDDYEFGYIELLPSPWKSDKAVLVITGTTDRSASWSLGALMNDQLNYKLTGNLAILTSDNDLRSLDTRVKADEKIIKPAPTPAAAMTPEPLTTPQTGSTLDAAEVNGSPISSRSVLLWPLLGASLLLIFGTLYLVWKRK